MLATIALTLTAAGCSRTGLFRFSEPDVEPLDVGLPEVEDIRIELPIADIVPEIDTGPLMCPDDEIVPGGCGEAMDSERVLGLCDGLDNDCDGSIDEGCTCVLGDIQACFGGPPDRAATGACQRGTQRCSTNDDGELAWGVCANSVEPSEETCDEVDNDCDGCVDEFVECEPDGSCPTVGDPRVSEGTPLVPYVLDGSQFYFGEADSWRWRIEGGICDDLGSLEPSFTLNRPRAEVAEFIPRLSGAYRVSLTVGTPDGPFECSWIIDVGGLGSESRCVTRRAPRGTWTSI